MKRPTTTTRHSTDFDVISGPSMASACPIVESEPETAAEAEAAGTTSAQAPTDTADAA